MNGNFYVPNNKDFKNKEQDKKIFIVFFVVNIILIAIALLMAVLVVNKIDDISNIREKESKENIGYNDIIENITGESVDIESQSDLDDFNKKEDNKIGKQYDYEDYAENLISGYDGGALGDIGDAINDVSNDKINSNLDALIATLYLDSEYYKSKIDAHDYKQIKNPDYIDYGEKGFSCSDLGVDTTTEAGAKECSDYYDKHLVEWIHDPNDKYISEVEGMPLTYALNHANEPTTTNMYTGRSMAESTHNIQGWLFSTSYNAPFYTPYPISYVKVLDVYIRSKLYNRTFNDISNPVVIKGNGEKKDSFTVASYLIFTKDGIKYKASFYNSHNTYKLLDIEII